MKTGKSIVELAQEIQRQADAKKDYILSTKLLTMTDEAQLQFQNGELNTVTPNTIAHQQIADRLDIPKKYYDRMKESDKPLLATNVNHWFQNSAEKRLVRTMDGKARAFLSDRFHLGLEYMDIASAAIEPLLESGAMIQSAEITDTRMYIKAVLPKIEGEVKKGDIVQAGIAISNSEVGRGALTIQPLVYRLVCLNGAIFADSKYSARHLGSKLEAGEDLAHLLSNEALAADDKALTLKVRDIIRASFDQAVFAQRLETLRAATGEKIEGNPVETIELLARRHNLSETEKTGILRRLIEGADLSKYGLHNAVTNMAQEVESYDRATELETMGGTIINLDRSAWRELAIAA